MEASELRINNFVVATDMAIPEGEMIAVINGIQRPYINMVSFFNRDASIDKFVSQIKPIPLTEEWLLKFGFNGPNYEIIPGCYHYFINNKLECSVESDYIFEFEFVHQLQNLYFALTGEELIIKS